MNDTFRREGIFLPMRVTKATSSKPSANLAADSTFPDAFEELFLEHWAAICRLLSRLTGDPAEAEDLAMETFMRLYQRSPQTGDGSNLQGWLYRVATNLGLNSIRSYQRRQWYEQAASKITLEDPPQSQPAEILDSNEAHNFARQALSKMKVKSAQLLSLRYSGLSYQEIALAMGLAPASIGPLLLRAEREFAQIYTSLSKEER
jgi:RNA polymerase sigma-70 factor (ECF subfamily)